MMTEIINKRLIKVNIDSKTKEATIKKLADLINVENRLNEYNLYLEEVFNREKIMSTAIGMGIAIPHAKTDAVNVPTVAVGRLQNEIEWDNNDSTAVKVVFLLAIPERDASDRHLRILAAISKKLLDDEFADVLFNSEDEDGIYKSLQGVLCEFE